MGDTRKKSTKVPEIDTAYVEVARGVILDGRLALHHPGESWLAISDLPFGYNMSRRRDGGLWPMWAWKRSLTTCEHWSGGAKYQPNPSAIQFRHWACSASRVFEVPS